MVARSHQGRVPDQRVGRSKPPRRLGTVRWILRSTDQRGSVICRVEEAALCVAEAPHRHIEQRSGQVQPRCLPGHLVQNNKPLRHTGVVAQDTEVASGFSRS